MKELIEKTHDNQVNAEQTLNEFRNSFNTLNNEVGSITGLRGTLNNPNSLVDAINVLEDKTFFLQTFEYTTTTDQSYSGADANGNVLKYRQGKVQVYLDGVHLVEGGAGANGYTIQIPSGLFYTGILLNASSTAGQILTVYAYTGSQSGVLQTVVLVVVSLQKQQRTQFTTLTQTESY